MKRFIALFIAVLFVSTIFSPFAAAQKKQITFWTTEKEKDRMDAQKKIAQAFSAKTGISVKVVPVEENLLKQKVTAAYAAKSLPDVIFHPIDFTIGWSEEGILNVKAASEVIGRLGASTFGHGPLNLVRVSKGYAAVPVDGWGQLLLYRMDLFKAKNLAVPDTWDAILAAAKALNDPPRMWGFDAATDPGQTYTQQVFEHIALSNGVRLIDAAGKVSLNTPEMIETLKFYKSLTEYGPPGNIYWLHTRMDYLSDRTAMMIWSPYILDELSGLRRDQPVLPDLAKGQPGFLAKNTGFVTIIKGPRAAAQYGQISYIGITVDANADLAKQWVEYLLTDGYLDWLAMAPEGKMPMRKGTAASPDRFISGWKELEFGATSRAKISEFYGMDTVKSILSGVEGFNRWGFAQGQGVLVSKIYGTKVITKILKQFLDDEISAEQAAQRMDERVKALQ
ncbi:MAG: extracellular solute-binding protein [Deltaproteobacteria bacterium]|nr:extracellular solute-binding protein [Deltaproteobacteria bacterium]